MHDFTALMLFLLILWHKLFVVMNVPDVVTEAESSTQIKNRYLEESLYNHSLRVVIIFINQKKLENNYNKKMQELMHRIYKIKDSTFENKQKINIYDRFTKLASTKFRPNLHKRNEKMNHMKCYDEKARLIYFELQKFVSYIFKNYGIFKNNSILTEKFNICEEKLCKHEIAILLQTESVFLCKIPQDLITWSLFSVGNPQYAFLAFISLIIDNMIVQRFRKIYFYLSPNIKNAKNVIKSLNLIKLSDCIGRIEHLCFFEAIYYNQKVKITNVDNYMLTLYDEKAYSDCSIGYKYVFIAINEIFDLIFFDIVMESLNYSAASFKRKIDDFIWNGKIIKEERAKIKNVFASYTSNFQFVNSIHSGDYDHYIKFTAFNCLKIYENYDVFSIFVRRYNFCQKKFLDVLTSI